MHNSGFSSTGLLESLNHILKTSYGTFQTACSFGDNPLSFWGLISQLGFPDWYSESLDPTSYFTFIICCLNVVADLIMGFIHSFANICDVVFSCNIVPWFTTKHEVTGKSELSPKHDVGWRLSSGILECGAESEQKPVKPAIPDSLVVRDNLAGHLFTVRFILSTIPSDLSCKAMVLAFRIRRARLRPAQSFLGPSVARGRAQIGKSFR